MLNTHLLQMLPNIAYFGELLAQLNFYSLYVLSCLENSGFQNKNLPISTGQI